MAVYYMLFAEFYRNVLQLIASVWYILVNQTKTLFLFPILLYIVKK